MGYAEELKESNSRNTIDIERFNFMEEVDFPKELYHYTSISTLASILKNETIKFNNLSHVDDLEEEKSQELKSIGQYVFVSCWSSGSNESIPNWTIYGNKMNGVRIKLPIYPFKAHIVSLGDIENTLPQDLKDKWNIEGSGLLSFCRPEYIYNRDHYMFAGSMTKNTIKLFNDCYRDILCKVDYTNDKNLIYPSIFESKEDSFVLKIPLVGIYKNNYWSFQREWRYRLVLMPFSMDEVYRNPITIMQTAMGRIWNGYKLPVESLFLDIDNKYFDKMEITMGPLCNDGDYYIVEQLLKSKGLNPEKVMKKSDLTDKIRNT